MESTRENLPERLRWYHNTIMGNPLMAPFAPIMEAAEEIERLRAANELMSIGANHIANVLIGQLGGGFAREYPPHMPAHEVLAKLGAGDTYEAWCCWSAAMRSRDLAETVNMRPDMAVTRKLAEKLLSEFAVAVINMAANPREDNDTRLKVAVKKLAAAIGADR